MALFRTLVEQGNCCESISVAFLQQERFFGCLVLDMPLARCATIP